MEPTKKKITDPVPVVGTDFELEMTNVFDNFGEFVHKESRQKYHSENDKKDTINLYKWCNNYVVDQMTDRFGLIRLDFPEEKHLKKEEFNSPTCPVYFSHEFVREDLSLNKDQKCVILVQGAAGSAKAGIWSREACLKENLFVGSALPFIDACRKEKVAILVMNPNCNKDPSGLTIVHSETPDMHFHHVWKQYIENSGFNKICVVAQGSASQVINTQQFQEDNSFYKLVTQLAFVEGKTLEPEDLDEMHLKWMRKHAVLYRAHTLPCGNSVRAADKSTCPELSAGHPEYNMAVGSAFDRIMAQFDLTKYKDKSIQFTGI